jgi:hypothetical protein
MNIGVTIAVSIASVAGTSMRRAGAVLTLVLVLALACTGGSGGSPGTPAKGESTSGPATVTAEQAACAAGSGQAFRETQAQAGFAVYCPTFLPEGFALEEISFLPLRFAPGVTPSADEAGSGVLDATFTDPVSGASVMLAQGSLGLSFVSSLIEMAEQEGLDPQTVAYGELEGSLYAPLTALANSGVGSFLIAVLPDGTAHVLQTEGIDVETAMEIAAGMRPVSP